MALYGVVAALAHRLRAVFTPYFRYVLDDGALAALGGGDAKTGLPQAKKKRKKAAAPVAAGDAGGADPAVLRDTWLLRLRVRLHIRSSDCVVLSLSHKVAIRG